MQNVCIFAASSPKLARHYIDAAFALGAALAENGIGLVFGGGRTGLMGRVCARCAGKRRPYHGRNSEEAQCAGHCL